MSNTSDDPIVGREHDFRREIESAINRHSKENGSDTPDFILAEYLSDCLKAWDKGVSRREKWYGRVKKFADVIQSEELDS